MSKATIELMARNNNKPTSFELGGKSVNPCPFCGSADIYIVENDNDYNMCWCGCSLCGCEGPYRPDRRHAIQVWQKRSV